MNYRAIRRATPRSYKFHRRIDGRAPPAEVMRPYEKLPIPTDLAIVHITLLVRGPAHVHGVPVESSDAHAAEALHAAVDVADLDSGRHFLRSCSLFSKDEVQRERLELLRLESDPGPPIAPRIRVECATMGAGRTALLAGQAVGATRSEWERGKDKDHIFPAIFCDPCRGLDLFLRSCSSFSKEEIQQRKLVWTLVPGPGPWVQQGETRS